MAIYKRPNSPYWWINIPQGPGKPRIQRSSGTEDKEKARMIEQTLFAARGRKSSADKLCGVIRQLMEEEQDDVPSIPLDEIWQAYERVPSHNASRAMMSIRRGHLNRFLEWLGDRYPTVANMRLITESMAFAYSDHLSDETATGKTYNAHRSNLYHIWKCLQRRAALTSNIWETIPRASEKDSESGRAFSTEENNAIFKAAEEVDGGWWYAPAVMALYTGLRLSSIKELRWDEIEGGWLVHTPTKTKAHKIRVRVPLHPMVCELLADLETWRYDEKIFPWLSTRKKEAATFADVLAMAGINTDGHVTFHCWRHTFRTLLAEAKVAEDAAKRLGGWTTDIHLLYNHDEKQLQDAIGALPTMRS